jgi:D-alanyl-D-alanine carboxypeptidase
MLYTTSLDQISIKSSNGFYHKIENTNTIVGELPNILASKTGFTDLAGGNLAVIIDPSLNRPILIVVLGSTKEGRFQDVSNLAQKTIEYLSYKN